MYNPNAPLVTFDDLLKARDKLDQNPHFVKTPMLLDVQNVFEVADGVTLHMKLENTQVTGRV